MTEQAQTPSPTFRQRLGRFLLGLTRLVLFVLIVGIITAAVFYAIPSLYSYIFLPVQNNRVVIEHLRRTQEQVSEDLNNQLADQRERITQLESNLMTAQETRSELENKLVQQAETISAQATAQAELAERLESQNQAITALEQSIDALDVFLTDLDTTVANVEQAIASPETEVATLQRRVLILQMNQAILNARLHLTENNGGRAQLALEHVDQALEELRSLAQPAQRADVAEIQTQLQAVISAIEEQPFIAIQELEILWQLLQTFSDSDQ